MCPTAGMKVIALRSVLGSMEEATTTTFDPPTSGLVGEEATNAIKSSHFLPMNSFQTRRHDKKTLGK